MASFLDTFEINTAVSDKSKLDLGHSHITTANFMQLNPILCKEMVPGERCDVNMMTFSRMQPLAVPTFGRANIKERAFFVPMRTIFPAWNDFITDTAHVPSTPIGTVDDSGNDTLPGSILDYTNVINDPLGVVYLPNTVPLIANLQFVELFTNPTLVLPGTNYLITSDVTASVTDPDVDPYDICCYTIDSGGTTYSWHYYLLSDEGRQMLKVIESLGYKIVWDCRNTDEYSALPLLALVRIYLDWYFPSAYVNANATYYTLMSILKRDALSTPYITKVDMLNVFGWIGYVNFDADYFVSAWDNPNSPATGVYSNFMIKNIDTVGTYRAGSVLLDNIDSNYVTNLRDDVIATSPVPSYGGLDAPFLITTVSGSGINVTSGATTTSNVAAPISEYSLHSLHALTDYLKRHLLVGARAMDRYLARFGKTLSAEKLNRCNYIASKYVPLQIGDVTSMADTSTGSSSSNLGSFVGKGMAYEQGFKFDWSTDEYGYLIVLSSIVPAAGIWQGLDRKVMHKTKLSFWTPEFDNLGVQAISMREIYNNYNGIRLSNSTGNYMSFNDSVFGFAPRYGEYKYMNDQLTGNFNIRSINMNQQAGDSAWHLMRSFHDGNFQDPTTATFNYGRMVHSANFVQGLRDHAQFDRIFIHKPTFNGKDNVDPFTMIYDFEMVSYAPMKSLYDTYEFEDKGKKVKEAVNGVKMN